MADRTEGSGAVLVPVGVLVAWTLFVWGGRIRNVLADPGLHGADRVGPLLLSMSFVVLAAVVLVALVVDRRATAARRNPARGTTTLRVAVVVLALWTTAVWVVRAVAIAVRGGHPFGFVAVHVVLAVISVAVAAWAVRAVGAVGSRSPKSPVGA